MIRLTDVTEENWTTLLSLSVRDDQTKYLAAPVGILARAYVYRNCNAKVRVIQNDNTIIGLALIREFTDEPLGYELQQFMIDQHYQGKGYGSDALALIIKELKADGHFNQVEVCVKMEDVEAIHVYEKFGFKNIGYIDEDVPDAYNLIYRW